MIVTVKKSHANNKIILVVLYMRSSGQLSNILFFYEDILHKKAYKAHKQLLLRYFIRLRAYKANMQLLLKYYA